MSRRLVHVLTVADSLAFIDTVVLEAQTRGFEVTVITSPDPRLDAFGKRLGVRTLGVPMPRRVSVWNDWVSLNTLYGHLKRLNPQVVHAHTPKGGLLGMLAAQAAQVPVRLYQMRGLAYVTARGPLRGVLQTTERLSCAAATRVTCQSHSLHAQAVGEGLVSAKKSEVVLEGSNGVDATGRFDPARHVEAGKNLRRERGISADAMVVGFVGRLVKDKGVPELVEAFSRLPINKEVHLLVAGPFEPRDPVPAAVKAKLEAHPRIHLLGSVSDPAPVYAASDVVVLPSHREGFPNVPLEAAAMGLPVVATRIPGCIDAVVDGETGVLVEVGKVSDLTDALARYLADPLLGRVHGATGRARALRSFSRERVAEATVDVYDRELAATVGNG